MEYREFIITSNEKDTNDVHRLHLSAKDDKPLRFISGQYVYIKNPSYKPEEEHPFSIASSPLTAESIEFSIRQSGDWTEQLLLAKPGSPLFLSHPQGVFTLNETDKDIVFLIGGLGIAPVMSMLRTIQIKNLHMNITLLYGNRTPQTIAYKNELDHLTKTLQNMRIVHVFSHLPENSSFSGYRGFITKDIFEKEIDLKKQPSFYLIGPTVFIEKMVTILSNLHIPPEKIRREQL